MSSQYYFDTYRAKHKVYQEQMKKQQGGRSFPECVKYLCGWGPECQSNKPTQEMYEKAIQNFDEHFAVFGIQDEWVTSLKLFEKLLPTYFEGLVAEYFAGNNRQCEMWGYDWWMGKKCDYQKNVNTEKRKDEIDAEAMAILEDKCWADIALYQHAVKRFEYQANTCLA